MKLIVNAEDVTPEILEVAENIVDGWYQTGPIDWENVWERMENQDIDLGSDLDSPAMRKIQRHIRKIRKEA